MKGFCSFQSKPSFVILYLTLLLSVSCTVHIQNEERSTVCVDVIAKNMSTNEEAVIKYEGYYYIIGNTESTTRHLYGKPGDSINIEYYIHLNKESSAVSFSKINHVVIGFDWEKLYSGPNFAISITIPDLPSGNYPITCQTMYELNGRVGTTNNVTPIETTIILVVE